MGETTANKPYLQKNKDNNHLQHLRNYVTSESRVKYLKCQEKKSHQPGFLHPVKLSLKNEAEMLSQTNKN